MRYQRYLCSLIVVFAALVVPAAASARVRHPKPCVVPHVTGESLTTARRKIDHAGCKVGRIMRPKVAAGVLIVRSQTPRAGRHVKHGTKLRLTLRVKATTPTTNVRSTQPTPIQPATPPTQPPTQPPAQPATPATPATQPTIAYTAVDPTFKQNPGDGLQVTFAVSASATEISGVQTINLGAAGELPAGVLNFYSGGVLACSQNVGGSITGGPCTITYPAFGSYTVVTEYLPVGATPVSETEQEMISPLELPSSTTLAINSTTAFNRIEDGPFYSDGYTISLTAGTNNPEPSEYVETVTDVTTGQSYTIPPTTGSCCSAEIDTSVWEIYNNSQVPILPAGDIQVTGLLGYVADTDVIDLSVSTTATQDYAASPGTTVQLWPLS